jgi:hypothetical protein
MFALKFTSPVKNIKLRDFYNIKPTACFSFNSIQINKVTGAEGCLILSDAHAAPGSEGGGLYCIDEGRQKLVGLVVQTLVQVRGEAVSLCLCAAAKSVLAAALDIKLPLNGHPAASGFPFFILQIIVYVEMMECDFLLIFCHVQQSCAPFLTQRNLRRHSCL